MISIINKSTLVTNLDAQTMARACYSQIRYHLAPLWGEKIVPVVYFDDETQVPPGAWALAILDDPDQADALGWHTEDQGDLIYGRVFARPVLDNGGTVMAGSLTVASVLSHECCEIAVDPRCNLWADSYQELYALEVCDPVEDISYDTHVKVAGSWKAVSLSDFVTPAWFDPQSDPTTDFSYRDSISAPFTVTPGGYVVTVSEGQVSQRFGESYPGWRKDMKKVDTSRTARRVPSVID